MMLVQSGECCAHDTVRGTFALSSILGYRNGTILAILNLHVALTPPIKFQLLFVLRFYGPVNPMGSCRAQSVYLTTRLLGRLSPLRG